MSGLSWRRRALLMLVVAAVTGLALTAVASSSTNQKKYVLGVSNTVVGNGPREEIICSIKAEALASGKVSSVKIISANTSAAGQVAQIRSLISAGANAVIFDPADPNALNNVIAEGANRGVVMVSIDQDVTAAQAYQAYNNQEQYGYLGMLWLAKQLHGHGNVVELRGIAGAPADTARHTGVMKALKKYPGVHLVKSTFTGWQFATAGSQMLSILNSGTKVDGVWTSGTDYPVVNAFKTAGKPYVPVIGTDSNTFIHQLITLKSKGFIGAAVTNPLIIGAVGVDVALRKLEGKTVPRVTQLTPQVFTNASSSGLAAVKKLYIPQNVGATFGDVTSIKPYTHFTRSQLLACQGP